MLQHSHSLRAIGIVAIALGFVIANERLHADDWPQWRGPNLDMRSAESNWSSDWPEDGPPIRWKTNIGLGNSSVAVVGDRLWTMGNRDEKERVYCLSTKDGSEIWSHAYDGGLVANLHKGGPGSTPTVNGQRVFTVGKEGQLFCLEVETGKVVWQMDAPKELGVKVPEWGFTGSPLIVGEQLFIDLGRIVAIDKSNGKVLWKTNAVRAGYGSATPLNFNGTPAIAVLNNEGLNVLATASGKELAFHKWETSFATNSTSPIVIDDRRIFLSTGYKRGCTLLDIDGEELKPVYERKTMSNHMNNSVIDGGYLYGFHGNAHRGRTVRLVCIDIETGEEQWSQLGLGCGSLMIAGDKMIVLGEKGELVVGELNPKAWVELSRTQAVDYRCWTVPVLADGQVFCRNDAGDLSCVDLRNGSR